jgi:mRNA interferase MazF
MVKHSGVARGLSWGDIRMVEFGRPDKTRPALVLTRPVGIAALNAVTVAPITRTIRGIRSELALGVEAGLREPSVAKLDALQTVPKDRLKNYVGSISRTRAKEIRRALLYSLDLETDADFDS